jgi:hypothetical protein
MLLLGKYEHELHSDCESCEQASPSQIENLLWIVGSNIQLPSSKQGSCILLHTYMITIMKQRLNALIALAMNLTAIAVCKAFSRPFRQRLIHRHAVTSSSDADSVSYVRPEDDSSAWYSLLNDTKNGQDLAASLITVTFIDHRPLGCTIEESLATTQTLDDGCNSTASDMAPFVFVSKVQSYGFADIAGLKPGDVLVGVTGLFGEMENVTHAGIDKM